MTDEEHIRAVSGAVKALNDALLGATSDGVRFALRVGEMFKAADPSRMPGLAGRQWTVAFTGVHLEGASRDLPL